MTARYTTWIRRARQRLTHGFTQLARWLEWTELSAYRAGLYIYLTFKIPTLTGSSAQAQLGTRELYLIGLSLYLQLLVSPGRLSLLILSPILLMITLYIEGLEAPLPLQETSLAGGAFFLYCLLSVMELSESQVTPHREARPVYQIQRRVASSSIVSQLRGLSLDSLILCVWVTLSPLVLHYVSPSAFRLSALRGFGVSFPYSLFLLLILGAALRGHPPRVQHERLTERRELRAHLTLSLILCTLLSLLYLYRPST